MVLKGLDGPFGCIAAMDCGWCLLEFDILVVDMVLEEAGAFIVKHVELDGEASTYESIVHCCKGLEVGLCCSVDHRFSMNRVAVIVVEDEEVVVALAGW